MDGLKDEKFLTTDSLEDIKKYIDGHDTAYQTAEPSSTIVGTQWISSTVITEA